MPQIKKVTDIHEKGYCVWLNEEVRKAREERWYPGMYLYQEEYTDQYESGTIFVVLLILPDSTLATVCREINESFDFATVGTYTWHAKRDEEGSWHKIF